MEKSPKYSHQSNGAVEKAVRRIESLTRTYVRVLQEKLGYKVDSTSIVLPWLVRHAAYVLSRFVMRDDGRSASARLRGKECDSPLAQVGETVDFKIVWGEMAKLEPRCPTERSWAARTKATRSSWEQQSGSSLLCRFGGARETNNGSVMHSRHSQVCPGTQEDWRWKLRWPAAGGGTSQSPSSNSTARRQAVQHAWEFHRSTRQRAEKDSSGSRLMRLQRSRVLWRIQIRPAMRRQQNSSMQRSPIHRKNVRQTVGMKRGAEDNPVSSSAKRAHTPPPSLSQILPQPDVEMGTVPVPVAVPEDAMEVNALCEETC